MARTTAKRSTGRGGKTAAGSTKRKTTGGKAQTRRGGTRGQDVIALLKSDHKEVRELFRTYKAAGSRAMRTKANVAAKICTELEMHSMLEKQLVYPMAREIEELAGLIDHSEEEHAKVEELIEQARTMEPGDEEMDALMKELMGAVQAHVKEEESELLPKMRDAFDKETLRDAGEQMLKMKRQQKGKGRRAA